MLKIYSVLKIFKALFKRRFAHGTPGWVGGEGTLNLGAVGFKAHLGYRDYSEIKS